MGGSEGEGEAMRKPKTKQGTTTACARVCVAQATPRGADLNEQVEFPLMHSKNSSISYCGENWK